MLVRADLEDHASPACDCYPTTRVVPVLVANDSGANRVVAPYGSSEGRIATNPIAIGIPRPAPPNHVLDMATSVWMLALDRTRFLAPGEHETETERLVRFVHSATPLRGTRSWTPGEPPARAVETLRCEGVPGVAAAWASLCELASEPIPDHSYEEAQ
jgi:LDH2 family malate/lactate/ureidoglycolate dehydrogenase